MSPGHGFRFENKRYSLDSSTIDLSLAIFQWARFRERDGAPKLHVGLNHDGGIPAFMSLTASTIAAIYKQRWQIELSFRWIKQNLKIRTFLGVSKNAVMTQVRVAMCVYLMLA